MLNRGYAYTTIISKYHGQTLLSHLASLYAHSTPQAWQQKLNNGDVILNGVTATGSESVTLGQTLVWNRPRRDLRYPRRAGRHRLRKTHLRLPSIEYFSAGDRAGVSNRTFEPSPPAIAQLLLAGRSGQIENAARRPALT